MPPEEENGEEEGQEEEEEAKGPISGLLPSIGDLLSIVQICKCFGMPPDACCPKVLPPGAGKEGSPPPPAENPERTGLCTMLEANIGMQLGPWMGFIKIGEIVLDIPPGVPSFPFPPPLPMLGLPDLPMPSFSIPGLPIPGIDIPGLDIPGFFPEFSLDIPPFPGMSLFGLTLWPIDFALGLFTLDLKIPIPTADPCDLIKAINIQCPDIPGIPMLSIGLCILMILLLILMIVLPLLVILMGAGGEEGEVERVVLIEPAARYDVKVVKPPPPVIIKNPESARPDKIQHFDLNVTLF